MLLNFSYVSIVPPDLFLRRLLLKCLALLVLGVLRESVLLDNFSDEVPHSDGGGVLVVVEQLEHLV